MSVISLVKSHIYLKTKIIKNFLLTIKLKFIYFAVQSSLYLHILKH